MVGEVFTRQPSTTKRFARAGSLSFLAGVRALRPPVFGRRWHAGTPTFRQRGLRSAAVSSCRKIEKKVTLLGEGGNAV